MSQIPEVDADSQTDLFFKFLFLPDVLQLWLDSSLQCVRSVLTHTWQVCRGLTSKVTEVNIHTENRHAGTDCKLVCLQPVGGDIHVHFFILTDTGVQNWNKTSQHLITTSPAERREGKQVPL